MDSSVKLLKFQPFSSRAEVSFWDELARRKLEQYKLSDEARTLVGSYAPSRSQHISSTLGVRAESHSAETSAIPSGEWPAVGELFNTNTLEDFKKADKKGLLATAASKIWAAIKDGRAEKDPSLLVRFILLSFADLKKYKYVYWFGFPALACRTPAQLLEAPRPLGEVMSEAALKSFAPMLQSAGVYRSRSQSSPAAPLGFFLCLGGDPSAPESLRVAPLTAWSELSETERSRVWFGFVDPCAEASHPGWPLRNFLALISVRWGLNGAVTVLCLRAASYFRFGARDMHPDLPSSGARSHITAHIARMHVG